ncbi:swr1 complex component [Tulasnella sp. 417]|nr:swr1 complex component [Tulasnella sp. 417]
MRRSDTYRGEMQTPGAGPSKVNPTQEPSAQTLARREALVQGRRRELALIADHHDDLIREAFHLEKFVTLVHYDPKAAKEDNSTVFQNYSARFDLLRRAQEDASSPRKTRGSAQGLHRSLGIPPVSGPSSAQHPSSLKGKGKEIPPVTPPRTTTPRIGPTIRLRGTQALPPPQNPPRSPIAKRGEQPVARVPRRPTTSDKIPASAAATNIPSKRLSLIFRTHQSPSSSPSKIETPIGTQPTESPRTLKRIRLIHIPRLEYSSPLQVPPDPVFRRSLPDLLSSFFYVDEDNTVPAEQCDRLQTLAEQDARTRNRIAELQFAGVFEELERNREMDLTPLEEPKRPPDFQDALVLQAIQLSKHFRENSRARIAGARRIAKMVEKHFEKIAGAEEREQRAEEKRKTLLVKFITKEVVKQWKLAVTVIRERKKQEEKAEQVRRGKRHLDAFLQQSSQVLEAQQSDLAAAALARQRRFSSGSSATSLSSDGGGRTSGSPESSSQPSRGPTPIGQNIEDDDRNSSENDDLLEGAEDVEREGVSYSDEEAANLLEVTEEMDDRDGEASSDRAVSISSIPQSPDTTPRRSPRSVISRSLFPNSSESQVISTSPALNSGDDSAFAPDNDAVVDLADHEMDLEMEAEDAEIESDNEEIGGLEADADLPIEELLRQYGYVPATESNIPRGSDGESSLSDVADPPLATNGVHGSTNPSTTQFSQSPGDPEFNAGDVSALDASDRLLDIEMEAEEENLAAEDSDEEINGLEDDATVPIEEVLRRYGYLQGDPESTGQPIGVDETPLTSSENRNGSSSRTMEDGSNRRDSPTTVVYLSPRSPDSDTEPNDVGSKESIDEGLADDEPGDEMELSSNESQGSENVEHSENYVPPPFLLRGTLRPYQQAGLEWLASLHANNTNGILADEMGLGKTIQTIALLGYLACSKGIWGPHLIVVPTSVLLNWEVEFKRFLPGFKILSYYGSQKDRREKRQGWTNPYAFNVCITSYQLVLADQVVFRRKKWVYMILDEAHNIKNFKSKRWETLLCFNAQHRLLLTGTPLQNNLMELWSLLYFLMPDEGFKHETEESQIFVRREDFRNLFQNPVEKAIESGESMNSETKDTVQKLHSLLRPYLLRRLKKDVEKELPAKHEHIVYCKLSKRQRFLYDEFMSRATTKQTLVSGNFLSIINCLMQLRKVCNHPDLFEVRPIVTSLVMSRSAVADYEIKELLVRRRLLSEHEDTPAIQAFGLQITQAQPPLMMAERSTRRLDASSLFPHINDVLGPPPPVDHRTIAGWKAYREHELRSATISRWKHLAYVNRIRCDRRTLYPAELLHLVNGLTRTLLPLSVMAQQRRPQLDYLDSVHAMIRTHAERLESVGDAIDRFVFATPRVVAGDIPSLVLGAEASSKLLRRRKDLDFDILHQPAVKLQIAFPDASLIQFDCGKLQELDKLLRERASGGHRVLIFTQMTRVLDILEIFLNFRGHRYLRLDGATSVERRQIITERFNVDTRVFAFIASSRSGGVGIKAHRIGQTREVHIYRFISRHTIEEAMLRKANQKRFLDDMVIQKGEFDWRKMLVDELEGRTSGRKLEEALALVEDREDVEAARLAAAEIGDDGDFGEEDEEEVVGSAIPPGQASVVGHGPDEGEGDVGEGFGSIDDYMLQMVERDWEFFGFERPYTSR